MVDLDKIVEARYGCECTDMTEHSVTMTSSCMLRTEEDAITENMVDISIDKEDGTMCFYSENNNGIVILFPEQVKHLRQILADLESGEIWKTEMEQSGITF